VPAGYPAPPAAGGYAAGAAAGGYAGAGAAGGYAGAAGAGAGAAGAGAGAGAGARVGVMKEASAGAYACALGCFRMASSRRLYSAANSLKSSHPSLDVSAASN
jgi:hypothetical protein